MTPPKPWKPKAERDLYRRGWHRKVWEEANGRLPDGWVVHHIDGDVENNDLANLQAMPNAEHVSLHQKGRVKSAQERENIAAAKRGRKRGLNGEWL